ncbi:MAG TPA: response regulator [Microthrixaceae bacterium]|nr:response regulator [Microthrixaceae bacterium]MCO5304462.1 response regulator [Microthrixaceae bacterium]HMR97182.1 response regulator [Microthrixaceae bacterium]HMU80553.1 response regulator [Microthrixaceae bacterium]HMV75023.1 response regulator [Microthrixaceae bacterium]
MPTTIVVAEDEAIIRMDLTELLQEEGYDVVGECGRGDEAVRLVRELRPDVALLDIKMPGQDGISAAREISAERLSAVVLVTAFSQRELIEEASDAGVHGYVVKPFERHDLAPAIEVAISRFRAEGLLVDQIASAEDRLAARKVVDRAKGVLMDGHGLSEADAYSFIQRSAMADRRQMRDVAQDVLDGSLSPRAAESS